MGEKMTLREVLDGVLVHVDGIAPYAEVPVVDLQAWADTLTAHLTQPAQAVDGASLIAAERQRQKDQEGWTPAHDEIYTDDEMVRAAICYAARHAKVVHCPPTIWPWSAEWWKPRSRRDDLVRAGALIAAELDRLAAKEAKS